MKTKVLSNAIMVLGIICILIFANLQIIMTLLMPAPFFYTNIPFPVNQKEYTVGDRIVMTTGRCSNESKPVSVVSVKEMYNTVTGTILPLPPGSGIIPPGCTVTEAAFTSIFPDTLEESTYVIRGVTTFRGRFGTVDVSWQTQPFAFRR